MKSNDAFCFSQPLEEPPRSPVRAIFVDDALNRHGGRKADLRRGGMASATQIYSGHSFCPMPSVRLCLHEECITASASGNVPRLAGRDGGSGELAPILALARATLDLILSDISTRQQGRTMRFVGFEVVRQETVQFHRAPACSGDIAVLRQKAVKFAQTAIPAMLPGVDTHEREVMPGSRAEQQYYFDATLDQCMYVQGRPMVYNGCSAKLEHRVDGLGIGSVRG